MLYFIMSLLSENPAGGPQLFAVACDGFYFGILLYQIIKAIRKK